MHNPVMVYPLTKLDRNWKKLFVDGQMDTPEFSKSIRAVRGIS